jgi:hypothetical protein
MDSLSSGDFKMRRCLWRRVVDDGPRARVVLFGLDSVGQGANARGSGLRVRGGLIAGGHAGHIRQVTSREEPLCEES